MTRIGLLLQLVWVVIKYMPRLFSALSKAKTANTQPTVTKPVQSPPTTPSPPVVKPKTTTAPKPSQEFPDWGKAKED